MNIFNFVEKLIYFKFKINFNNFETMKTTKKMIDLKNVSTPEIFLFIPSYILLWLKPVDI